jgi:hypothetical protein
MAAIRGPQNPGEEQAASNGVQRNAGWKLIAQQFQGIRNQNNDDADQQNN